MNRTGGLAFLWFTVVQVTTQLVGLVYLSAQPQNYLPDVFPQSITHNSKPDIWVSSYITHVLLIYMHVCQLCVIYAGITIDARTGHMLVELHYWVDLYLDITSSPPPVFWRQDWYSYISTRELGLTIVLYCTNPIGHHCIGGTSSHHNSWMVSVAAAADAARSSGGK